MRRRNFLAASLLAVCAPASLVAAPEARVASYALDIAAGMAGPELFTQLKAAIGDSFERWQLANAFLRNNNEAFDCVEISRTSDTMCVAIVPSEKFRAFVTALAAGQLDGGA